MRGLNFKNLIEIWNYEETENAMGDVITQWQLSTKAWADIKTMKGREYYAAATIQKEDVIRFIIRYIPEIEHHSRIKYKGTPYKIESLTNDDAHNRTITIIAESISTIDE